MKTTEIISGTYLLSARVHNPTPDRRSSSWTKKPTFEPGRYFVSARDEVVEVGGVKISFLSIIVSKAGEYGSLSVTMRAGSDGYVNAARDDVYWGKAAEALVTSDAFTRDVTFPGFLRWVEADEHINYRCVVERLVKTGAISEDLVRMAIASQIAEDNAEDEAEVEEEALNGTGEQR